MATYIDFSSINFIENQLYLKFIFKKRKGIRQFNKRIKSILSIYYLLQKVPASQGIHFKLVVFF